ncbi:MAG: hypothetical protein CM15mP93_05630 [Thiotrichaceae bacterium]|nr:MAG: hypothetical protein CM15mP93_05630 [Thiotrichaceae bacterium]
MGFESLENFLVDDNTTIEGLPAPLRAVFIAEKSENVMLIQKIWSIDERETFYVRISF